MQNLLKFITYVSPTTRKRSLIELTPNFLYHITFKVISQNKVIRLAFPDSRFRSPSRCRSIGSPLMCHLTSVLDPPTSFGSHRKCAESPIGTVVSSGIMSNVGMAIMTKYNFRRNQNTALQQVQFVKI